MRPTLTAPAVLLMVLATFGGCVTSRSATHFSVNTLQLAPPSLMVAKKSPRTAVLVLDTAKVPAELAVLVDGEDRGGRITDVHAFVQRDLVRVFKNYFEDVQVLTPDQPLPSSPHAVIDVKIDRVEVRVTQTRADGIVTRSAGYAAMTWGLALRLSEASEYLYSFAGQSAGAPGGEPPVVLRSMFEAGISDMLSGYTEKKVHAAVLSESPEIRSASETQL